MPIRALKSDSPGLRRLASLVEGVLRMEFSDSGSDMALLSGVVMESLEGCTEQAAHTDLDPADTEMWKGGRFAPGGVLFSLEDDTRLVVWDVGEDFFLPGEGSPGEKRIIAPRTVHIPAGRALYFRGDVVHAGASYAEANLRLHWYVHRRGTRIPNRRYDDQVARAAGRRNTVLAGTRDSVGE